jgi:hypothetical protein
LADEELMLAHGLEVPDRISVDERREAARARAAGIPMWPGHEHEHEHDHEHERGHAREAGGVPIRSGSRS